MIRWLALAGLVLAVPAQAQSDDAAIRGIVRGIYKGYEKADGSGIVPRRTARLAAIEKECAALGEKLDAQEGADSSYGMCGNDYDLFCQCQDSTDIPFGTMKIEVAVPSSDRANAVLQFMQGDGPDLKLLFVRGKAGWELDDLWEYNQVEAGGEGSHRARLIGDIAGMRKTLKLPAWKEPGL